MKRLPQLLLALASIGCSEPITLVVGPDAAASDGGTPPIEAPHCEIAEGASWVDHGPAAITETLLPPLNDAIAIHEGTIAVAGFGDVHVTAGEHWQTLSSAGLPHSRLQTIAFHDGTWWVGVGFSAAPFLFRYVDDATGWVDGGTPSAGSPSGIFALLPLGDRLLASTNEGLFVHAAGESTWAQVDLGGTFLSDVVVSGDSVYVVLPFATDGAVIQRSTDLAAWETIPWETGRLSPPGDLAAGGGTVIATIGLGASDGYYRLDDATGTFVAVLTPDGIAPTWIAEDGTVMGLRRGDFGNETVFASSLGAPWVDAVDVFPTSDSSGISLTWRIASEGSAIVIGSQLPLGGSTPFGVELVGGGATRVIRSEDHGRTFQAAIDDPINAPILDAATDGETYVVRVRGDLNQAHFITLGTGDVWIDRTDLLESPAIAGVSGVEVGGSGYLITRPSEYSQVVPHRSTDGATSWLSLGLGYPSYTTNISWGVRRVSAYAMDPEGRLYAATIGGMTSLCCDGTETGGFDYRPGAGVWRWFDEEWQPVNAGIPIEAGPPPTGGAPFRSDVRSIAWTALGMIASFEGRGVHRLVSDRWQPEGVGIPVDLVPTVAALEDTAIAWGDGRLFVLDEGVWIEADLSDEIVSLATRHDLLVRATREGVAVSGDRGETWSALDGVDDPRRVTLARGRLFATDGADHVHTIAIACTEAR